MELTEPIQLPSLVPGKITFYHDQRIEPVLNSYKRGGGGESAKVEFISGRANVPWWASKSGNSNTSVSEAVMMDKAILLDIESQAGNEDGGNLVRRVDDTDLVAGSHRGDTVAQVRSDIDVGGLAS